MTAAARPPKGSADYVIRRERNNLAVRKSREKAKRAFAALQRRESALLAANAALEARAADLTTEVARVKQLYLSAREAGLVA